MLVKNELGSVWSNPARVRLHLSPEILALSHDLTIGEGSDTLLWVKASGKTPLIYQWQHKGIDLPGATNSTLILTQATLDQSGYYSVSVSNELGIASSGINLMVKTGPQIMEIGLSGGTIQLTIKTKPGKSYILEATDDLMDWHAVTNFLSDRVLVQATVALPRDQRAQFYRVAQQGN